MFKNYWTLWHFFYFVTLTFSFRQDVNKEKKLS